MLTDSFYVYQYTRPNIMIPFYIGKGKGTRMYDHIKGKSHNELVKKIISKLDRDDLFPVIKKLFYGSEEYCFAMEKKLIAFYGKIHNGTGSLANFTDGGEGVSLFGEDNGFYGKQHTDESKEKIRQSKLGVSLSQEHRDKISAACKGINLGKKHTDEQKLKNSIAHVGINHPNYGKHLSDETKEKIRKSNLNKKVSEETRLKQSIAAKKRWADKNERQKYSEMNKAKCNTEEARKKLAESGLKGAKIRWNIQD